jgi:hypothetical protein
VKPLGLTKSLGLALRRFRLHNKSRKLWVDQISINQNDIPERNAQIKLMNDIYKNVTHVLAWLGEDVNENAKKAFNLVMKLHQIVSDCKHREDLDEAQDKLLETSSSDTWKPLVEFFVLPWVRTNPCPLPTTNLIYSLSACGSARR